MNMLTQILLVMTIVIIILNISPISHIDNSIVKENFASPYEGYYRRNRRCEQCDNYYWGDRCLSPYCGRQSWWYNEFTPLPWGNTSRTPNWLWPPYTYIQQYYDGWY